MQFVSRAVAGQCKHYAYSTEKTYVYWARRFVLHHNKRHPLEMGEKGISEFLTYLAVEGNVAASTQNQALSALTVTTNPRASGPANCSWSMSVLNSWPR
jgi:hypothetical protein